MFVPYWMDLPSGNAIKCTVSSAKCNVKSCSKSCTCSALHWMLVMQDIQPHVNVQPFPRCPCHMGHVLSYNSGRITPSNEALRSQAAATTQQQRSQAAACICLMH